MATADGTGSRRALALGAVGMLLAAFLVFGSAPPAAACSCTWTPADAVAHADAVFTGSVAERSSHADDGYYLFTVDRVFKGPVHQSQWVFANDNSSCGTSFSDGETYVVIARGEELQTDHCQHSTPVSAGLPEGLGAPSEPLPGTSPRPDRGGFPWQFAAGLGTGVAASAGALAGISRVIRRRTSSPG